MAVTVSVPLDDDSTTPSGKIRLLTLTDPAGHRWIPGFADEAALRRWISRDRRFAEMPASRLFAAAARERCGVIVEPNSPHEKRFRAREVVRIAEGRAPTEESETIAGHDLVLVSASPVPPELVQLVTNVASQHQMIERAYVLNGHVGRGPDHPVIGLLFADGTRESQRREAMTALWHRLESALRGDFADCISLTAESAASFGDRGAPVFIRTAGSKRSQ